MKTETLFSSNTDEWSTPQDFYNKLDAEFHFNLDPCANENNHKCGKYFTKDQDGLLQNWGGITSFVIHHTEERYPDGYKKLMKKAKSQTLQL